MKAEQRGDEQAMAALPFRVTVCGIEELTGHCADGVSHVLSILDPNYPVPKAFGAFGDYAKLELRFNDIIGEWPGMIAPRVEDVARLLTFGGDLRAQPSSRAHLLVHCHAGISRSTASLMLILAQAMPDEPADAVMTRVLEIRDRAWPNLRIVELGDTLLDRRGTLVSATHRLYRQQLDKRPELAEQMINVGRGREVAAARLV